MPDLHGWITQQIDDAEAYALDHILNPTNALRRCEADRRILTEHQPQPDGSDFPDSMQCRTCSTSGGDGYHYLVPYPCPTVLAVAEDYGEVPAALRGPNWKAQP